MNNFVSVKYEDLSDDYKETLEHNGKFLHPFHVVLRPPVDGSRYRWRLRDEHHDWVLDNCGVNSNAFPKLPSNNGLCEVDGLVLCVIEEENVPEFKLQKFIDKNGNYSGYLEDFIKDIPLIELDGVDLSEFQKREDETLKKVRNKLEFLEGLNGVIDGLIETHGLSRGDCLSILLELKEENHLRNRRWVCEGCYPMNKFDL